MGALLRTAGHMDEAEHRRREFIRAHHPDRGGDPDVFIAGMRAFRAAELPPGPLPRVVVVKHRAWPIRMIAVVRRLREGRAPSRVR